MELPEIQGIPYAARFRMAIRPRINIPEPVGKPYQYQRKGRGGMIITPRQKVITYAVALLGAFLFTWPVALLMLMIFADFNGDISTSQTDEL